MDCPCIFVVRTYRLSEWSARALGVIDFSFLKMTAESVRFARIVVLRNEEMYVLWCQPSMRTYNTVEVDKPKTPRGRGRLRS